MKKGSGSARLPRFYDCGDGGLRSEDAADLMYDTAEEKETQARELRQTKLDEARSLAVMEVAGETERIRAELMNPENGQEKRNGDAIDVPNALETEASIKMLGDVRENPLELVNETKKDSDIDTKEYNDYTEENNGLDQTGYVSEDWINAGFPNEKSRKRHEKHLVEYGDISFDEYVQGARELLSAEVSDDIDEFRNNIRWKEKECLGRDGS